MDEFKPSVRHLINAAEPLSAERAPNGCWCGITLMTVSRKWPCSRKNITEWEIRTLERQTGFAASSSGWPLHPSHTWFDWCSQSSAQPHGAAVEANVAWNKTDVSSGVFPLLLFISFNIFGTWTLVVNTQKCIMPRVHFPPNLIPAMHRKPLRLSYSFASYNL